MIPSSPSQITTALRHQSLFPARKKSQQKGWPGYTSNMCSIGSDYHPASLAIETPGSMLSLPENYVDSWVSHKTSQQLITREWMDNQKPPTSGLNSTFASTSTITKRIGPRIFPLRNLYTIIGQMKLQGSPPSCSLWDITHALCYDLAVVFVRLGLLGVLLTFEGP